MEHGGTAGEATSLPQQFRTFFRLQPTPGPASNAANMSKTFDDFLPHVVAGSRHLPYYVTIGAVVLAIWLIQTLQSRKQKQVDAPFYKASILKWMFDAENAIQDSYNMFCDRVYQIKATEGVQVLLPPKLVGEIKGLPEDILSATAAVDEAMLAKYTQFTLGHHGDTLSYLVRSKFTQNLTRLVPKLKEELEFVTATEFPECKDWTPVKFQPFALRAIARLSGRAFVGLSISRQEQWMETSVNFATHVFMAVVKLQFFPDWLRPIGSYLVSDLRQIKRDLQIATDMLTPVLTERLRDMDLPSCEETPDDLIQWLLEVFSEEERLDFATHARIQLVLAAASIHTTNNLLTDCIYDLAVNPDLQEMLREEAYTVLELEGGWARKESLAKLKKMDSFMKESQRLAGNITSFIRKVVNPIDLSDGTHLPAGTKILAPQTGISHDNRYYADANSFDALRFYKMRQESDEDANKWQFTSISDLNLNFGAGKHACPGRFFAGNEIKMALAYFLLNYDIRLKEGEKRPKPMVIMMTKAPDPNAEVLFRRRTVQD